MTKMDWPSVREWMRTVWPTILGITRRVTTLDDPVKLSSEVRQNAKC